MAGKGATPISFSFSNAFAFQVLEHCLAVKYLVCSLFCSILAVPAVFLLFHSSQSRSAKKSIKDRQAWSSFQINICSSCQTRQTSAFQQTMLVRRLITHQLFHLANLYNRLNSLRPKHQRLKVKLCYQFLNWRHHSQHEVTQPRGCRFDPSSFKFFLTRTCHS